MAPPDAPRRSLTPSSARTTHGRTGRRSSVPTRYPTGPSSRPGPRAAAGGVRQSALLACYSGWKKGPGTTPARARTPWTTASSSTPGRGAASGAARSGHRTSSTAWSGWRKARAPAPPPSGRSSMRGPAVASRGPRSVPNSPWTAWSGPTRRGARKRDRIGASTRASLRPTPPPVTRARPNGRWGCSAAWTEPPRRGTGTRRRTGTPSTRSSRPAREGACGGAQRGQRASSRS
mmetsp:Transcript_7113/g.14822  ORF Transcript_7113/g.14822 Transcript_7113/m.14822 type:complete len:233 (-) Transcript_7113:974-1672(-)